VCYKIVSEPVVGKDVRDVRKEELTSMSISPGQEETSYVESAKGIEEGMQDAGTIKIDEMLCFTLYAASRAAMDVYRPLLDELGITYPQYLVMIVLWEYETSSVKDIGNMLRLDSGTLSPLLKRLESAGFIKRQRRANDERVVDISLTAEGRALQERASDVPAQISCKYGIEIDEYKEIMKLLKKLIKQLSSYSHG
jgi:DNA-binding MarR family transcriptional regulator